MLCVGCRALRSFTGCTTLSPRSSWRHFSQTWRRQWDLGQGIVEDTPGKKKWNEDEKKEWKTWVTTETPGRCVLNPSLLLLEATQTNLFIIGMFIAF